MKVSIIIPVFNNWNFTKACIRDLNYLPNDHEIILVDNGSTDNTKYLSSKLLNPSTTDYVDSLPTFFKTVKNKQNMGFGYACNQGYNIASGDYIIFLNNDIRVKDKLGDWTRLLVEQSDENSLVGPTGGLIDKDFNFIKETNKVEEGIFYMSGWCLCARKEVWKRLEAEEEKVFAPEYFAYFEDTDLSMRAKEVGVGFKVVEIPVVHFGRTTGKKLNLSDMYIKSKEIFTNKWKGRV